MNICDRYDIVTPHWIKNIRQNWKLVPLKHILKERDEIVSDKQYPPLSVSKIGVLPQLANVAKTNAGDKRKAVYKGDFVINSRSDRKGASGLSEYEGSVSLICIVYMIEDSYNKKFIHYLLRSNDFIEEFYRNGHGIVSDLWTTRNEDVKNISFPIPPHEEQTSIVRFLDSRLTQIDQLIAVKRKQIELLKDRKTRIIDKSLAYGIESNVKVKDSGINWIGKINLNWKIATLKDILSSALKYGANESAQSNNKSDPRYIRITDIDNNGKLKDTFVSLPMEIAKKYILKEGDILFARSGATVGKAFLYEERYGACCYAGYLIKASVNINLVNPKFLIYYARSSLYNAWINVVNIQATIQNISAAKYRDLAIPLPPIELQNKIVHYLDEKIAKMRYVEEKINSSIELLNEYRTRLISDAVTGAIDVRDWKRKGTNKD